MPKQQRRSSAACSRRIADYFLPAKSAPSALESSCFIVENCNDNEQSEGRKLLSSAPLVRRQAFLAADFCQPGPASEKDSDKGVSAAIFCWPLPPAWCIHVGWQAPASLFSDSCLAGVCTADCTTGSVLYNYGDRGNSASLIDSAAAVVQFRLDRLPIVGEHFNTAAVLANVRALQPGFPAGRYLTELRAAIANTNANNNRGLPCSRRSLDELLAPRCAAGVLGNAEAVRNLSDWLASAAVSNSSCSNRVALIEGPGRSCVARAIARQHGLRVFEIGAEERRHGAKLAQRLHQAATCCQVERKWRHRNDSDAEDETDSLDGAPALSVSSSWLILLDDADQPLDDEPSLRRLVSSVCASSRKPLLLAAADAESLRRGLGLTDTAPIFKLRRPSRPLVAAYARVVCLALGCRLSADAAIELVDACRGDIRQLLNLVHFVLPESGAGDCRLSIAVPPAPIDAALLLLGGTNSAASTLNTISQSADVLAFADWLRRRRRRCAEAADQLASSGLSLLARLSLPSNQIGQSLSGGGSAELPSNQTGQSLSGGGSAELPSNQIGQSLSGGGSAKLPSNQLPLIEPRPGLGRLLRDLRQPLPSCRPFGRQESLDRAEFARCLAPSAGFNRRSLVRLVDRKLKLSLSDSAMHYLLKCNTLASSES
ncbi:hypothetical protein BOX15_Mlig001294g3 [Macrostomum lignano]|uniref:ATPase AAA-type core domain-containing protein n=1 Tax=Macrostomum lignano TaxID=282301 RepID=A0A267GIH7_9PLAT|nr:hypothetical protein BOX15_Mlig001294g3 [Macrostomum lignano]